MQQDHLAVPSSSSNSSPQQSPPQNATFAGRPRSGSQRSSTAAEDTDFGRRPSIRIRRAPSSANANANASANAEGLLPVLTEGHHVGGRSRSNSAPQPPLNVAGGGSQRRASYMPGVAEEFTSPTTGNLAAGIAELPAANANANVQDVEAGQGGGRLNGLSRSSWRPLRRARTNIGRAEERERQQQQEGEEYESELVDILDLVGKRTRLYLLCRLTLYRSGGPSPANFDECPEFPRGSVFREVSE